MVSQFIIRDSSDSGVSLECNADFLTEVSASPFSSISLLDNSLKGATKQGSTSPRFLSKSQKYVILPLCLFLNMCIVDF